MNCLQDGHTSNHCKAELMCPYCAEEHPADKCELKCLMTSNCTACARALKLKEPETDLGELFSTTPANLSHSPLDPTCPTRVAQKRAEVTKAISKTTNQDRGSHKTPPLAMTTGEALTTPGCIFIPETPAPATPAAPPPALFDAGANDADMTKTLC